MGRVKLFCGVESNSHAHVIVNHRCKHGLSCVSSGECVGVRQSYPVRRILGTQSIVTELESLNRTLLKAGSVIYPSSICSPNEICSISAILLEDGSPVKIVGLRGGSSRVKMAYFAGDNLSPYRSREFLNGLSRILPRGSDIWMTLGYDFSSLFSPLCRNPTSIAMLDLGCLSGILCVKNPDKILSDGGRTAMAECLPEFSAVPGGVVLQPDEPVVRPVYYSLLRHEFVDSSKVAIYVN